MIVEKPFVNDAVRPDYEIHWRSKKSLKIGRSAFFSYGNGKELVKEFFSVMFPDREVQRIKQLEQG